MASFDRLGRALRWIRQRQGKKQYQVASGAKITKAMLSSYENEKQRPTLETLERILDALEIDLDYLAHAMREVRHEDHRQARRERQGSKAPGGEGPGDEDRAPGPLPAAGRPRIGGLDIQRLLALETELGPAEEQAIAQMLNGFHSLLRYLLHQAEDLNRAVTREEPEGDGATGS